jgi:putative flippase GtrA
LAGLKPFLPDELRSQMLRFFLVGMGNTTLSYVIYCLGLYLGLSYWLASLMALFVGLAVGFVAQGRLVFKSSLKGRLPIFALVWALIYGANIALISLFAAFGMTYYMAGALGLFPTVLLSFFCNRYLVFRSR